MTATPFFHVGFLVNNLEEAMERFTEILGVDWTGRTTASAEFREPGKGSYMLDLDITYSKQGPVHIELMESQGDGFYSGHEGFHHLGLWEPDPEKRQAEFVTQGLAPMGTQYTPEEEIIVSYFDPSGFHGVMLELVDESRRADMERWFSGEPFAN